MIEFSNKITVVTEEINNNFIVYFIDKKTFKEIFKCSFLVYRNFDSQGLIDDAIDVFNRKMSKN